MNVNEKVVDSVVSEVAGADVVPLVRALKNKSNVSEFILADKIDREINETRNMLYRLFDANLVTFMRKKDKKKGWYIYYWTFNARRVADLVWDIKKKKAERLRDRLKREQGSDFFVCKSSCIRLSFDQAVDFEYKCPECGQLMEQENNQQKIQEIALEIAGLESELKKKAR
ncbi:MAG TPA: hypothetical protein VJC16_03390 [Candidatus Nanoarchaeia archaeon]|nr:hypothetical protein [Candidatus Nanoarchaeia archaeon]